VNPWDETGETELEYCRRVARENESQRFRLQIIEEGTALIISDSWWNWRMIPGAAVMIEGQRYFVRRITTHPTIKQVSIVWVEEDK
jgi:hypothetical protein